MSSRVVPGNHALFWTVNFPYKGRLQKSRCEQVYRVSFLDVVWFGRISGLCNSEEPAHGEVENTAPDICSLWIKVNRWDRKILGIPAGQECPLCWHKGNCDSLGHSEKEVVVAV